MTLDQLPAALRAGLGGKAGRWEDSMGDPRSEFVRGRIRRLPFTDAHRAYVNDLLAIERLTTQPANTWAGGLLDDRLRSKYPREYEAIARELSPTRYERSLQQRAKRRRALHAAEQREAAGERRRRAREREMWARVRQDRSPR
jgi:hypothetical protein